MGFLILIMIFLMLFFQTICEIYNSLFCFNPKFTWSSFFCSWIDKLLGYYNIIILFVSLIRKPIRVLTNGKLVACGWPTWVTNILNGILDMNDYIKNKIKQKVFMLNLWFLTRDFSNKNKWLWYSKYAEWITQKQQLFLENILHVRN